MTQLMFDFGFSRLSHTLTRHPDDSDQMTFDAMN